MQPEKWGLDPGAQAYSLGHSGGWDLGPGAMAVGLQLAVSPSQPGPKGGTSQEQHYSPDLKGKETALPTLFRRAELFKNHKYPLVIMSPRRALVPQGNEQSPLGSPVSPHFT